MVAKAARLIRRQPVVAFFVLSFGISWAMWAPLIIFGSITLRLGFGVALLVLGVFGPTLAALLVSFVEGGPAQVSRLLSRALVWRVTPRWYLLAGLGPIFLMILAVGLSGVLDPASTGMARPDNLLLLVPLFFVVFFCGPLEQELGWRGYALPKLQARHGALTSALVSGLLWGLWHVPLFWTPGAPQQISAQSNPLPVMLIVTAVLYDTSLTVLFTWFFNHTGGSVLIAFVFHTSIDTALMTPVVLGITDVPLSGNSPIFLLFLVLVLACVARVLPTLAVRRLSYPPGAGPRTARPY